MFGSQLPPSQSPEGQPSRSRGPPRRKHHKSKTGCQTCKRRHIRCDETPGQCQNCSRHRVRCDYASAVEVTQPETSPTPPVMENIPSSAPDLASPSSVPPETTFMAPPPMVATMGEHMDMASISLPSASLPVPYSTPERIGTEYPLSSASPTTSAFHTQAHSPYPLSMPSNSAGSLVPEKLLPDLIHWQQTGNSPFAEIPFRSPQFWNLITLPELRMIHHICGIAIALHRQGLENCSTWVRLMPRLLALAVKEDYVLKALIGFAASHLACNSEHDEFAPVNELEGHLYHSALQQFAQHYRIVAYDRVIEIISTLSLGVEDGDSLLAGLLLLSWQTVSWQTWNDLQANVQMVMAAVNPMALAASEVASAATEMACSAPLENGHQVLHF